MDVFHIPEDIARDAALRLAEAWLRERRGSTMVVVPVRDSIHNSAVLARITFTNPWVTRRTLVSEVSMHDSSVAVIWPTAESLGEVKARRPREILVVPWRTEESDAWLRANNSVSLIDGAISRSRAIDDPITRVALADLGRFINKNNNLVTYDDRDEAIRILPDADRQSPSGRTRRAL